MRANVSTASAPKPHSRANLVIIWIPVLKGKEAIPMGSGSSPDAHPGDGVGAGMLTVMLFPALGAKLAGMQREAAPAVTLSMSESGEHL